MRPASLLVTALLAFSPQEEDWERVLPGLELAFPADHGAHPAYAIEWWYITGQVESDAGRRFGFQFTVFRRGLDPGSAEPESSPLRARQVLAGHLALTDVTSGRTLFAERLRRAGSPLAHAAADDLDLALEDWSLARGPDDRLTLSAGDAALGIGLELELAPRKPLVLHGAGGYSSKGADPGNASAYSSWTRLATNGQLRVDGAELEVGGEAWFDHEFGTSVLEEGVTGWDWFGLHLADGRDLMAFRLRREDGTDSRASAGTLVGADGAARSLGPDDFTITPEDAPGSTWTSPASGATYPARWRLAVPSAGLELEVVPLVSDCELRTTRSTGVAYWEGPVELRDAAGVVQGRGYAELTGYAGSMAGRF